VRDLEASVDRVAAGAEFSGVVRIDRGGQVSLLKAYGLAHRDIGLPNTVDTQFNIASGTKGLTALTVVSLIEQGILEPSTTARSVLGKDLPLIDDEVTVEHLLAHRSGIGDYFDEELDRPVTDHVLPVPVHELASTEDYLRVLDGLPSKFRPDERFSYCNSGYVVLALIAERSLGMPFHELVVERVCRRAGMPDTAFLRSDELSDRAAVGYLSDEGLRTNVLHLPIRGSGDGGIYSTAADIHSLWIALFAGRIVSGEWVAEMVRPRSDVPSQGGQRYGLGFWLRSNVVILAGYDAGASFRTVHDPAARVTHTVLSNTTEGAWPLTEHLDQTLSLGR
jgi:CubicO group peptidase (beta-lactamase class C family)